MIQSRLSGQDERLTELDTYALKVGSPVNAYGQRIRDVGRPIQPDDAVPLWYLERWVATQAQVAANRADGGDGDDGLGPIGAGSDPPTVALPNLFPDVSAYASAHPAELAASCLATGGNWSYMQGLIAYLQAIDPRVGGNGKRGNTSDPSQDALAYYHGTGTATLGSKNVYVIDVIGCHCPDGVKCSAAYPVWNNVTTSRAAGAWMPTVP